MCNRFAPFAAWRPVRRSDQKESTPARTRYRLISARLSLDSSQFRSSATACELPEPPNILLRGTLPCSLLERPSPERTASGFYRRYSRRRVFSIDDRQIDHDNRRKLPTRRTDHLRVRGGGFDVLRSTLTSWALPAFVWVRLNSLPFWRRTTLHEGCAQSRGRVMRNPPREACA